MRQRGRWEYLIDDAQADGVEGRASASSAVGTVDDVYVEGRGRRRRRNPLRRRESERRRMRDDGHRRGGYERDMEGERADDDRAKGGVSIKDRGCMTRP